MVKYVLFFLITLFFPPKYCFITPNKLRFMVQR